LLFASLVVSSGCRNVLDVGCGQNSFLSSLREIGVRTTGIDADPKTIEQAERLNLHDAYICGNIFDVRIDKDFDAVVCSHVIEHFTREDGLQLLIWLEKISRKLLYIETPVGFLAQGAIDRNVYQRHLSGWYPADFRARGYRVYGSGIRFLRGNVGKARFLPESITRTIERLGQNIIFRAPSIAHALSAIRYLDTEGNLNPHFTESL
jgi:SAM-dependent methyltransferase